MKNVLCALCVLCGLSLAADWPTPPAGYAYETDLRPHALVLTNATAAGLATHADLATATNAVKADLAAALKPTAIYTPDGQTWTDATGCVWRIDQEDYWMFHEGGSPRKLVYRHDGFWSENPPPEGSFALSYYGEERWSYEVWEYQDGQGYLPVVTIGSFTAPQDATNLYVDASMYFTRHIGYTTNLVTRVAYTNELANLTTTIPQTVTNVVRDVQGLVYDEKLGITWKQIMYDGNLYYVAVTNANITEVAQ